MIEAKKLEFIEKEQEKREFIYKNKMKIIDIFGKDTYEKLMIEESKAMESLFTNLIEKE